MGDVLVIQNSKECKEAMEKLGYLQIESKISNMTEVLTSLSLKL